MSEKRDLINQSPVFSVLSEHKKDLLKQEGIDRQYRKGALITCEGDKWPYMFIVMEGRINALKNSIEGRSLVVTSFGKGDIFWGLSFFHDDMGMVVSLEAVEPTRILMWSADQLIPIFKSEGSASWELSRLMIFKMMRASEILEEMTFQPVAGRLAKLLIETVQNQHNKPVTRSLTLDEMAARIGSTREMVCRFLHRFADDGIIDITRTEFRVVDSTRLAKISRNSKG